MKANQHLEQSVQEEQIREALDAHWRASAAGDVNAEQSGGGVCVLRALPISCHAECDGVATLIAGLNNFAEVRIDGSYTMNPA